MSSPEQLQNQNEAYKPSEGIESLQEMPSFDEHMQLDFPTPTPEPGPTPEPEIPPMPDPEPEETPDLASEFSDNSFKNNKPIEVTDGHRHTPSRSAAFLKAQAIAREKGQRMVNDEKRPYIYSHEIGERVAKGEDINNILESTNGDGVWLHIEEFLDNGADVEKVFEYMPKDARWLRIDELAKHGYDINKLADKMSDTAVWLEADKFVKYGADIERLKQRLSSKDKYLKYLIDKGELFGSQNQ